MKFSGKDLSSIEEILNGKFFFLCSDFCTHTYVDCSLTLVDGENLPEIGLWIFGTGKCVVF